jgi:hypothetical protein
VNKHYLLVSPIGEQDNITGREVRDALVSLPTPISFRPGEGDLVLSLFTKGNDYEAVSPSVMKLASVDIQRGNVCCANLDQLQRKLIQAKERLRHKKEIIKSCSRQCGYVV